MKFNHVSQSVALRTWKRTPRKPKHLTARERRLLMHYDQALQRDAWRASKGQPA